MYYLVCGDGFMDVHVSKHLKMYTSNKYVQFIACQRYFNKDDRHSPAQTYIYIYIYTPFIHYYNIIQEIFYCPKYLLCTIRSSLPSSLTPLKPPAITDLFAISIVLLFPEHHMVGII